jgi:cysteinyl-tRNA synthetase
MKITLRKAHAIQFQIIETIAKTRTTNNASIDPHESDVASIIKEAKILLTDNLDTRVHLEHALLSIRLAVSEANAMYNVNDLLAKLAGAQRMIDVYGCIQRNTVLSNEIMTGRMNKAQSPESDYVAAIGTGLLDREEWAEIDKILNALELSKIEIKDELLKINISNHITLSDEDAFQLAVAGIIKRV